MRSSLSVREADGFPVSTEMGFKILHLEDVRASQYPCSVTLTVPFAIFRDAARPLAVGPQSGRGANT